MGRRANGGGEGKEEERNGLEKKGLGRSGKRRRRKGKKGRNNKERNRSEEVKDLVRIKDKENRKERRRK